MQTTFKHPLARKATVAKSNLRDGSQIDVLLIVTTLTVDPADRDFKADKVERLHEAARAYIAHAPALAGYSLISRPKDWEV